MPETTDISEAAKSGDGTVTNVGVCSTDTFRCPDCRKQFVSVKARQLHWKLLHDPNRHEDPPAQMNDTTARTSAPHLSQQPSAWAMPCVENAIDHFKGMMESPAWSSQTKSSPPPSPQYRRKGAMMSDQLPEDPFAQLNVTTARTSAQHRSQQLASSSAASAWAMPFVENAIDHLKGMMESPAWSSQTKSSPPPSPQYRRKGAMMSDQLPEDPLAQLNVTTTRTSAQHRSQQPASSSAASAWAMPCVEDAIDHVASPKFTGMMESPAWSSHSPPRSPHVRPKCGMKSDHLPEDPFAHMNVMTARKFAQHRSQQPASSSAASAWAMPYAEDASDDLTSPRFRSRIGSSASSSSTGGSSPRSAVSRRQAWMKSDQLAEDLSLNDLLERDQKALAKGRAKLLKLDQKLAAEGKAKPRSLRDTFETSEGSDLGTKEKIDERFRLKLGVPSRAGGLPNLGDP